MRFFGIVLYLATQALAHSGVIKIVIDGVSYPPWDPRIDSFLGDVKRIQWSYAAAKSLLDLGTISSQFGPVNNITDGALACGPNAKSPALTAVARAGAKVEIEWSNIIRMHRGPILSYMGPIPSPDTPATQIKFFKIDAPSYDASTDKWANERAADNGMKHTFQIPSDIKPGPYVMRTELLALHGNTPSMQMTPVSGPEFYLHCVNVDVQGTGSATPEGVTFPGAYKKGDPGLSFSPYYGDGSGVEHNKKYVTPGPALYEGKHDAPSGPAPTVKETGAYTGEIQVKYNALKDNLVMYNKKIIDMANKAWPANKEFKDIAWDWAKMTVSPEWMTAFVGHEAIKKDIEAFKVDLQKSKQ